MSLVNNFCCCNGRKRRGTCNRGICGPSPVRLGGPLRGEPWWTQQRNSGACNRMGLFTREDWDFTARFANVPNTNITCRCGCSKIGKAPISQGRSCACLIRPLPIKGVLPGGCGCNACINRWVRPLCPCRVRRPAEILD